MKIATWNVNSLQIRIEQVMDWLQLSSCDILCLQETKLTDDNFPVDVIQAAGYYVVYSGQKTYNGVAIIARQPIIDVVTDVPGLDDSQRRIICITVGDIRILNLYVVNGKEVGSDKYNYKLNWLERVTDYIADQQYKYKNFVVVGDFNIAPEDRDVYNAVSWRDKIFCSKAERAYLQKIINLGFTEVFRMFDQKANSFSWWDYRFGRFEKNMGLRIDLIFTTESMTKQCISCVIDSQPRQLVRPSDHAPVVAVFE